MATNRPRRLSPPPYRRYADPRASAGTVISSAFDPPPPQYPRSSIETLPASRGYDAQPIAKRVYPDPAYSGGTKSRTEYAVRPRHNSTNADDRRPPSIVIPPHSPARSRPVVTNLSRDRSPLTNPNPRDDSDRHIYPAVSSPRQHHQRHYSATPIELDRLRVADKDRRERARYRESGTGGYPASSALVRYRDDDVSYTGPREQFDRDFPSGHPTRRDSYPRRDRPVSALDFSDWKPPPHTKRELAPPPSAFRPFDRTDKADPARSTARGGGISDPERDDGVPRRGHSTRVPVSLHQDRDLAPPRPRDETGDRRDPRPRRGALEEDDTYASDRDHRDHQHASSHHDRRHKKHRDESPSKPAISDKAAAVGLGGAAAAAAAGLAGAISKSSRDNDVDEEVDPQRERRHRRRRDRDFDEADMPLGNGVRSERPRDRLHDLPEEHEADDPRQGKGPKDRVDSDSLEDEGARDRHRRRKHRNREDHRQDADSGSGSDSRNVPGKLRDGRGRDDANGEVEVDDGERRRRDRDRRPDRDPPELEPAGYEGAPGELEDGRPRRVQLVEPPKEREQEMKPKGILKPPRSTPFPEDPNPTREGVAPLKEAGKKGIPPGARWTKINRQLVNPAALEASHERFEERDEYVIVLRVLTREEIEKFATLTAEIREAREREWQDRHRHKENRHRGADHSSDEEDGPALAIEPPPLQPPPADLRAPPVHGLEGRPAPILEGRPGPGPGPGFDGRPAPDPAALAGYATEV